MTSCSCHVHKSTSRKQKTLMARPEECCPSAMSGPEFNLRIKVKMSGQQDKLFVFKIGLALFVFSRKEIFVTAMKEAVNLYYSLVSLEQITSRYQN